jgi:hypothetical protein
VSGEVAFGCEISVDRRRCAIAAAGREVDGTRLLVDVVWYDHPRGAVARLAELEAKHDPVAIVVDGASQSATLLRPLADIGIVPVLPTARDVAVAHGEFMDLVGNGGLAHLSQPPLTAAVRAAENRPLAGSQAWERKVPVDQSPLVAATLAAWAFLGWEVLSQPGTFVI